MQTVLKDSLGRKMILVGVDSAGQPLYRVVNEPTTQPGIQQPMMQKPNINPITSMSQGFGQPSFNQPLQTVRPSFKQGEEMKTNNNDLVTANLTFIEEKVVNKFYVQSDSSLHDSIEVEIKEIKDCKLTYEEDDRYKVISGDMTLSSPDIDLHPKMEEEIIKNLVYYSDISEFECKLNVFDLFFIAGNEEQARLAILRQLQDHDLEDDIDVIYVSGLKEEKDNLGNRNFICDVTFKIYNKLEVKLKVKLVLGVICNTYFVLGPKGQYPFSDIYKAIAEKIAFNS